MSDLSGTWTLDAAHSTIGFVVRHAMVSKVRGSFNDWASTINVDGDNPKASTVEATIKTASVDTRNSDRDAHLRTEDFFDTDKYPQARFVSTEVDVDADGNGTVSGELTLKGVTNRSRSRWRPSAWPKLPTTKLAGASRQPPPSTARNSASTSTPR